MWRPLPTEFSHYENYFNDDVHMATGFVLVTHVVSFFLRLNLRFPDNGQTQTGQFFKPGIAGDEYVPVTYFLFFVKLKIDSWTWCKPTFYDQILFLFREKSCVLSSITS